MNLFRIFIKISVVLLVASISLNAQVNPASISGLKLWFSGDSVHHSSPTKIDTCYDLSGTNHHGVQIVDSLRPQNIGGTLNGHKLINFDGKNDYLNFNVISDIRTVFWVIRESPTAGAFGQPLLGHSAPPYSIYHFHRGANGGGVTTKELWSPNNATVSVLNGTTSVNSNTVNGTTYNLLPNFSLISLVTTGNVEADNFSSDRYLDFPNAAGPRFWDGDLAELIIYNQALTPTEVAQVEQYLYDKYTKPVDLGPDRITCTFPITLKAKQDYILSYQWQDNSTDDSLVVNAPGTYYVNTTDVFGKISSDTVIVSLGPPTYTVALGNDTTICSGQQVTLNAGPPYLNYLWSNGQTTNTITVNSQATYSVAVTDCSGNVTIDSIKVTVQALPVFNFGADRPVCYNAGFVLDPGYTNTLTLTFNWNDNTHAATHMVTSSGTYSLEVIDNLGCSFSDAVSLQIDSSLCVLSLGPDISFCAGNLITLTSGMSPSLTYTWSTNSHNDSLVINSTGQYSVVVTNTNNCTNSDTINVNVAGQAPVANFSSNIGCLNNAVIFTNLSSPPSGNTITASDWNFGDPSSVANTSTLTNTSHTYTAVGFYTVTLKVTTNVGCEQTIIQTISVAPSPTVNFSYGIPCQNNTTAFTNQNITSPGYTITSLSWNFGDPASGLNNTSSVASPGHIFSNIATYSVTLVATNNGGCKDSLTRSINVISCNIIPTNISGLKLWLTGDSIHHSTVTEIDTCYDLSGTHHHGTQFTFSLQPHDAGVMLNGHKTISFDGSDDYLNFNKISDIRTVFWVIKENPTAAAGGQPLLGHSYPPNTYHFHRGATNAGVPTKEIWSSNNATVAVLNGTTSVNSATVNGSTFNLPAQFSLISLVTTDTVEADNFSSDRYLAGRYWDGNLAELIIYNQALTPTQVIQVEHYLHNKYTKPVDLGQDKAVCTFPLTLNANKDYFATYKWQDNSTADTLIVNSPGTYYVTTTDVFGKVTSDTININLGPLVYTVSLGNDTTICSGKQLILNAGPDGLGYLWSNGLTTNTISVNAQSGYSVAVTDCSGNISTDIINVTVKALPTFNFGADKAVCYNSGFILDPAFANSLPYTFNWNDNTHDSIHSITQGGNYILNVLDNIGCSFSDTINLQIDSTLKIASLGPDINLCAGNSITLVSGMSPSLTYTWSTNSHNDSLMINTSGQYSVAITNTNNCTALSTISVTVSGQAPIANFSFGIGCKNSPVSFTNLSTATFTNTIDSTLWNFGDPLLLATNTSTLSNPFHTFSDTGNYTIRLKVITNAGCEQTIIKNIHVAPTSTINFSNGISCQNDITSFLNQSVALPSYPIVASNWNFGDPSSGMVLNNSTLTSPSHTFSTQSIYTVKLVITNSAGCKDSLYHTVSVNAQVTASFTNTPLCANTPVTFQDNSIAPSGAVRSWTIAGSTASGSSPAKTFTTSGVFNVTLNVNSGQCTSTITKVLNVFLPPVAGFTVPNICAKDTVTITDQANAQSGILSSYKWRLNNVAFSTVQSPTLSIAAAGAYSVRQTVINSFGCKDSVTKPVTVMALPIVDFTTNPSSFYYVNSPVSFTPSITNASSYNWNITNTPTISIASPTVNFDTTGTYAVSLYLIDQQGCHNTKTKTLTVSGPYLDLAILNVKTIKDNDGFMTVSADLANYGSIPINTFDMHYKISNGGNIKETWNGTLNPNTFYAYTFTSKTAGLQGTDDNITCVEIEKVNGIIDQNTTNNYLCNSLTANEINVLDPMPNPSEGDIILPIILTRDMDYTITIYGSNGQLQYEENTMKGTTGLNFVPLPTSNYSRGCYIIKTMIDGKVFIKKFIKISHQ